MKKEHATLTPASKSLLEFRVDAHHIVVEENGTFSVGQVLVCWVGPGLSMPFWLKPWPHHDVLVGSDARGPPCFQRRRSPWRCGRLRI